MQCQFCKKELPEPDYGVILYGKGQLHKVDETLEAWPVCMGCLKRYHLRLTKLVKEEE